MTASGLARLAAAWGSVVFFLLFGDVLLSRLGNPVIASFAFAWLFGVIIWAAFGVVHEAEELAEMLGEPFGTLILTLSIVIIEVALIAAVMLGAKEAATLGRDTMFAVLMIVMNGVVGVGLLVGGNRHHQQTFNLQGASAYLAVLIPLTVISLVLPNFTTSTADGSLTTFQAVSFSVFTIVLYATFLLIQTGRHQSFFIYPAEKPEDREDPAVLVPNEKKPNEQMGVLPHVGLLLANILPIVILAKSLATVLDFGIAALGAPTALGGILIAMIVFTPEGISALRAVAANELQRAINLCLGAATSTVGLTVPAVLMIALLTGQNVVLGLSTVNMTLLATTLILSVVTFTSAATTVLQGVVHLVMFLVFLVLVFSP